MIYVEADITTAGDPGAKRNFKGNLEDLALNVPPGWTYTITKQIDRTRVATPPAPEEP